MEIKKLEEAGRSERLISRAEVFLAAEPALELSRTVEYYRACHLQKIGRKEAAEQAFAEIISKYAGSGWAELAQSHLETME